MGYSLKNIPIHTNKKYTISLISKAEHFLKRMRWKALFADNDEEKKESKENFGFKTAKTPPQHDLLNAFEDDIYELMRSIEFSNSKSPFQQKLDKDITQLRNSGKVIVPADKTTNMYLVSTEQYQKLLTDNVTKTYKKSNPGRNEEIDKQSSNIARTLELEDRIQRFTQEQCFITLKDHKENFKNAPQCRLINPAKNELGKISKQIMEGIINNMVTNTNTDLNLWKSTKEVLKWFIGMSKETKTKFVKFDIVEFYPSITEDLLDKAIQFALQTNVLSPREIEIIKHTKNALLFHKGEAWEKKDRTFDVTMGSYDGAETCELVGLYMLDKLKQDVPAHQIGLYRDDGLAIIPQSNGPKLDKIRKQITATFKKEGLKITIETNMVEVDFLDVTLNLNTGKYSPFRKPNDTPLYVNKHSNHPPTIIKQLPEMIKRRISDISCNKEEFDKAKGTYETALKNSGYDQQLEYIDVNPNLKPVKKKRARKIIWFNPPYSSNVTTNIGQKFFRLLDKHFPKGHRLHKLFNRNTVKLSYSCLPNIGAVLKSTRQQASKEPAAAVKMCNCRNPTTCPLEGQCLKSAVIYEATLDTAAAQFKYIGLTENTFKSRYSSHTSSFRHEKLRHSTELSKKVWEMKDCDTPYDISWKIIQHAHPYKGGTRECNLCLTEKLYILMSDCKNLLNKRRELVSKCRHTNKFMLKTVH